MELKFLPEGSFTLLINWKIAIILFNLLRFQHIKESSTDQLV